MDSGFKCFGSYPIYDSVKNFFFPFWNMGILKLLNQVAKPLVIINFGKYRGTKGELVHDNWPLATLNISKCGMYKCQTESAPRLK